MTLSTMSNPSDVEDALELLPSITFKVKVEIQTKVDEWVLIITSAAPQGKINSFDVKVVGGNPDDITFSVQSETKGQPDMKTFSLTMSGVTTSPISTRASAKDVETALEELFSVKCHKQLSKGTVITYESSKSWMSGRVSDHEPFCGLYSLMNPDYIYKSDGASGIGLTRNKYMCLAYKGRLGLVRFSFSYRDVYGKTVQKKSEFEVPNGNPDKWNFHCEDMFTRVNNFVAGSNFKLQWVKAKKEDFTSDLFIDQVIFNQVPTVPKEQMEVIPLLRMPQSQPNDVIMRDISVTGSYPDFEIELTPHNCGYNIPLFEAGPGLPVMVSQEQAATPPIAGSYTVSLDGETTQDPIQVLPNVKADSLIGALSSTSIGFTEVRATGTCSAFEFRVKMVSRTGRQNLMTVDTSGLTGDNVAVTVEAVHKGGLWFDPIMGSLLRTHHTLPQVEATINGVPTRCREGADCSFSWSDTFTPKVQDISPVTGSMGDSVVISGSGFSSVNSDNIVVIGSTPCTVTASSPTSITCTLNNGPNGEAAVKVTVKGNGFASGSVTFTYVTKFSGITATPGSVEGGSIITLKGVGFTEDATVTVDGNPCTITTHTESEIICITPRAASSSSTKTVDVVITQGSDVISAGQFTYNHKLDYTPVISSLSLTNAQVWGGQTITVQGSGFGNDAMPVTLGGENLDIISYSDTEIVATLPALAHGSYRLLVQVDNKGYADLRKNSIPDISYTFRVTSMYPDFGSLYGGTDLLIVGEGFSSNMTEMEVSVGPHACDITSLSASQIVCRIAKTGATHHISATGKHKYYGEGYAWDKDPHTVSVGDYVTWHWETPSYVSDIGYSIQQTATAGDLVSMPGGFSSGASSRVGSFTQRFTVPGTYHYWTGYMNPDNTIYFRGTIIVTPLVSHSEVLSVMLQGREAEYDTTGPIKDDDFGCKPMNKKINPCSDSTSLTAVPEKFNFEFRKCFSPFVNTQSKTNGTVDDYIVFTGRGFGSIACQNEVKFAEAACIPKKMTSSTLSCHVSAADSPPIGVLHEFEIRIANLGYAIVNIDNNMDKMFGLIPKVSKVKPVEGSKAGGTEVTITGTGFEGGVEDITASFDNLGCEVKSVTYTQIVCETYCLGASSNCMAGAMTATVRVAKGDSSVQAQCVDDRCKFTSSEKLTPTVTDVSPTTSDGTLTRFTIRGRGFGKLLAAVEVTVGGEECVIGKRKDISDTSITCAARHLPLGQNDVQVKIAKKGYAVSDVTVESQAVARVTLPAASSTYGGATLLIEGNGFVDGVTTVDVDGSDCPVVFMNLGEVKCTLPAKSTGRMPVTVTSNGVEYTSPMEITYSTTATPTVTGTTPTRGKSGDEITIEGNFFVSPAGSNPTVTIGGVQATVTHHTSTSITCTLGPQTTGEFEVLVLVEQSGLSNEDISFTYEIGDFTVSPATGTTSGGQVITLTGSGFLAGETNVTICHAGCSEVSATATQYICKTPSNAAGTCNIVATVHGINKTQAGAYTYDASLVSTVTDVKPIRAGTGGGTLLTVTGTNFGTAVGDISVTICGSICEVQTVEPTTITCRTSSASSATCDVEVQRSNRGLAEQISAGFEYIDLWSSPYTWGGESPPVDGDMAVIQKGQRVLLDQDTAILKMLHIDGGEVIFDEATVELRAENILITKGGLLQAGTEAKPFPKPHKATITMYGHLRSKELPIYGTKTLAVRNGTLNLYGTPTNHPWTRLAATAKAGSDTLKLEVEVDWEAGDEVVIATTGDKFSQKETEVRTIASVSGKKVKLTEPLEYEHIGVQSTYGSRTVHFRAEVGHLTRNVKFRGDRNVAFDTEIKACPEGFNMGEFAVQTCFQGRFGDELGSDQFGGCVMVHQPVKDTQIAQAHISYVEFKHVGQGFRMGRYPIHFHLNGDMDQSFVRGVTIRDSYNRAVNIHGSHNALVEHNVIYNIMGGAYFLEDGDETGNILQYNLALFVRSSTSLRNDDITPAGFWATNPNNIIRHNHVAGGTHFGTWYRMRKHPEGPGYDVNICPQAVPLGEYSNNTAHSLGWFGLWIFEEYVPKVNASCDESADSEVAKFYSLTAWNCKKGVEAVNAGALQFRDFVLVANQAAGYEGKMIIDGPQFDENNGPGLFDSLIVASDPQLGKKSTRGGAVLPYKNGFLVKNVEFHNFDQDEKAAFRWTRIAGFCVDKCGGFTTHSQAIQLHNSPNKVLYSWESEGVIIDLDGTLVGKPNHQVVPCSPSLDSSECDSSSLKQLKQDACVCSDKIKLVRFAFNHIEPKSIMGSNAAFTSKFGTSISPYKAKAITHKDGWSIVLMADTHYTISFVDQSAKFTNISYDSVMYGLEKGEVITFTQQVDQKPDIVYLDGPSSVRRMSRSRPSGPSASFGDWHYSASDLSITYAITPPDSKNMSTDLAVNTRISRCYFRGCQAPGQAMTVAADPSNPEPWSNPDTWADLTASGFEPVAGEDLTIPQDRWILVDKALPKLGKLVIEGGLQIKSNLKFDVVLEADYIHITGMLVAGFSEAKPFKGKLRIVINGHAGSELYPNDGGVNIGAKFIGVFGGLQLHGQAPAISKTQLTKTASIGDSTLTVEDKTGWAEGSEILLTTTDYNAWHTETFTVSSVSGNVITLNDTVKFKHLATTTTVDGETVDLKAHVALLTRNIKIEGNEYPGSEKESFGARVIVGQTVHNGQQRSGFGQLSNVEFYHTGQEGYHESSDARFSLTYMDTDSTPSEVKYSYVKGCAFHNGYSTAIGAFNIRGLEIDNNIVHHTVGPGIRTEAAETQVTNNLVALSIWPGAYLDRYDENNMNYEGAIEAQRAFGLVLTNNIVAGSERLGFHVPGQACLTASSALWSNNKASATLAGVATFPKDKAAHKKCVLYTGFTLWKNYDFGFYYNNVPTVRFKNNLLIENGVAIFPMVIGPDSSKHEYADKSVTISENTFVGKTSSFSYVDDVMPSSDHNIQLSKEARSHGNEACGKFAIVMTTFTGTSNSAPKKPFAEIMTYFAIGGRTIVERNLFANYGSCTGARDTIIITNQNNEDASHPVYMKKNRLENVEQDSKVFFHKESLKKINPSDCGTMACDGKKKAMIIDQDGSFLGHKGTILPNSAYEWDGNSQYGLGDYRIPAVFLTTPAGEKLDAQTIAPHKGIFKTDTCEWREKWRGFDCQNTYNWRQLSLESMDEDTEDRKLSPVAIYNKEGYIDLINGPQDHGWCNGYTCSKRLSTFQAIVALDNPFEIYLSSTNPKTMRFMLMNSDPNECVALSMWSFQQGRLEVAVDGVAKLPTNGYLDDKDHFRLRLPTAKGQFMPEVSNKVNGENYLSRDENKIYWTQCGSSEITITQQEAVVVSFTLPAMSEDEFFGDNIVENLAAFLDVPPSKVRIVNIVSETSTDRRKRSAPTQTFVLEISDAPGEEPSVNSKKIATDICNQAQMSGFDDVIHAPVLSTAIQEPDSPAAAKGELAVLQRPGELIMDTDAVGNVQAGIPFSVQPKFRVIDDDGNLVTLLGSYASPWIIKASLHSASRDDVILHGDTSVPFEEGWANFTNLVIDNIGEFVLQFNITEPPSAAKFSLVSSSLKITARNLGPRVDTNTFTYHVNDPVELDIRVIDRDSNVIVQNIDTGGLTWSATAYIHQDDANVYPGSLSGTLTSSFNLDTGKATFDDLRLSAPGRCPVRIHIVSNPPDYSREIVYYVDVVTQVQGSMVVEESHTFEMKFPIDFNFQRAPFWSAQLRNYFSTQPNVRVSTDAFREDAGKLVVTLNIEATAAGYKETISTMCEHIQNGTQFTFDDTIVSANKYLTVDGISYGRVCGEDTRDVGDQKPSKFSGNLGDAYVFSLFGVAARRDDIPKDDGSFFDYLRTMMKQEEEKKNILY